VDQGKVVLAGRRGVRAFSLTETVTQNERVVRQEQTPQGGFQQRTVEVAVTRPQPAWEGRVLPLPEGSAPGGRGFLSGHRYFFPLTSAEVVAIDVEAGRVDHTAKSRSGTVPGNMICYKGKVISQGFDRVEKFYQADAAREEVDRLLAANPNDPKALALRGELLLDQDQQAEAVACFRRAYEMDHDERTRTLLRDALLDGLRRHFAEHRGRAAQIEQLLDDATQRAVYLRLMAAGLQQSGEWLAALQQYEKLVDLDPANRKLEAISPAQSVRRDRWVQAQLAALRSEIKDEQAAAKLDGAIQARLEAALKADDVDALRQFIDYFGNQAAAAMARRELVRRLADSDRTMEAELTLWSDQQSRDPAVAGPAVAQLAELLRKAGRDEDAAACYQRLGRDFAAVVCLDGKTGQQLIEALPDALRQPADAAPPWPIGQVEFSVPKLSGPRQQNYGRFAFPYEGSPAPFFTDTKVLFDQSRRAIVGYDGWGNERWQVSLSEISQQNNFFFGARNMTQLSAHGDLLLVAMGLKLLAVDGSGRGDRRAPRLLWDRDLSTPGLDGNVMLPFAMPMMVGQFRVSSYRFNRLNNRMSAVGPSTSRYVCFQQFKNLVALEPLNGNVLWIYHDVPPGSELFGDDDYVFALPPNQTEALVFRALDGQPLGKKSVPRVDVNQAMGDAQAMARIEFMPPAAGAGGPLKYLPLGQTCLATLGRRLLIWRQDGPNRDRVLELYDPWEQRHVWPPRKFAAAAQADVVDDEAVGVCEPDGHLVLLSLPEGRTIVDTKFNVTAGFSSLGQLVLWQDDERYVVVTHNLQNVQPNPQRHIQPLPNVISQPITRGWVWAFDHEGKPVWPEPVMVKDQQLPLDQPRRVPVVVFACQEFVRQSNNAMRNQTSVLCIDKRTGRKIAPESLQIQPNGVFDIVGDPKKHTVELRFQQNTLTMTFTDKPWPPDPKPSEAGKSPATADGKKAARSLWGSVKRAMGGLIPGGPDFLPEDLFEEEERIIPPPAPAPLR
jgi:tetratricopeptide (TPR) repeat protein